MQRSIVCMCRCNELIKKKKKKKKKSNASVWSRTRSRWKRAEKKSNSLLTILGVKGRFSFNLKVRYLFPEISIGEWQFQEFQEKRTTSQRFTQILQKQKRLP